MSNPITRRAAIAAAPLVALAPSTLALGQDDDPPLVVFLVRHAEKSDDGNDPGLTEEGKQRARRLATMLRDTGITAIHSTPYTRTRDTAAPVAKQLGIEVETYDPRHAIGVVKDAQQRGGRHLIVGHSNTTPALVEGLGGAPGEPIVEATEYDRLYIVTLGATGEVSTVIMRY